MSIQELLIIASDLHYIFFPFTFCLERPMIQHAPKTHNSQTTSQLIPKRVKFPDNNKTTLAGEMTTKHRKQKDRNPRCARPGVCYRRVGYDGNWVCAVHDNQHNPSFMRQTNLSTEHTLIPRGQSKYSNRKKPYLRKFFLRATRP